MTGRLFDPIGKGAGGVPPAGFGRRTRDAQVATDRLKMIERLVLSIEDAHGEYARALRGSRSADPQESLERAFFVAGEARIAIIEPARRAGESH